MKKVQTNITLLKRSVTHLLVAITIAIYLSIAYSGNSQLAVAQLLASNNTLSTSDSPTAVSTFNTRGSISSLVSDLLLGNKNTSLGLVNEGMPTHIFILNGNWSLSVSDGNVRDFNADFIMVTADGNQLHTHSINNLTNVTAEASPKSEETLPPIPIALSSDKDIVFSGIADIFTNSTAEWKDVPITISIFNGNVVSILPDPGKVIHFNALPIYGTVSSITDQNNRELHK